MNPIVGLNLGENRSTLERRTEVLPVIPVSAPGENGFQSLRNSGQEGGKRFDSGHQPHGKDAIFSALGAICRIVLPNRRFQTPLGAAVARSTRDFGYRQRAPTIAPLFTKASTGHESLRAAAYA
jgi:hypothetical protein